MISSEMGTALREAVQSEFHLTLDIFDNFGNQIGDSDLSEGQGIQLDVRSLSEEKSEVIPIYNGAEICYYFRSEKALPPHIVAAIKMFARAIMNYERKGVLGDRESRAETLLVTRMLAEDAAVYHHDILAFGADLGYKLEHPMGMIVVSLETNYNYCLNMNLGYESATNDAKYSIRKLLKEHMYMNKQDIVAFVQNNSLVVLKAIEELNDVPKIYKMIDKLSEMIREVLKSYRIFRYYIAPGEIINSFDIAHRAYREALEYISFAQKMNLDHPIITQDDVLYYSIISHLPNKARIEIIEPKVKRMLSENQEMVESLIQCFDAYIDNGFNIASTADAVYLHRNTVKKRMDKLYRITGFDPLGEFKDVMMNKLIIQQYLIDSRE